MRSAPQQAGTAHHTAEATAESLSGGSIALGGILIATAVVALVAWLRWR